MINMKIKQGYIGTKKIEYYEPELNGEYSYIDGEWTFLRSNSD
jgi:hypothetical protein